MLAEFLSVAIAGLAIGSVYALMALAINLVFSARRVVNFEQGDVTMLAGLAGLALIAGWAAPTLSASSPLRSSLPPCRLRTSASQCVRSRLTRRTALSLWRSSF